MLCQPAATKRHATPGTAILAALALALPQLPACATTPTPAPAAARPLVFTLTNSRDANLETLLAHAQVDGVALQEAWSALETAPDQFAWTSLDAAIAKAQARGKRVTLHLLASPHPPSWLAGQGAAFYSGTDPRGQVVQDVVPWDPVYLDRFGRFLDRVAEHLRTQGTTGVLFDVSVAVPVAEMNLVACRNGKLGDGPAYDRAKYLNAWKTAIDAFQRAFPGVAKFVSPPVGGLICAPAIDTQLFREILGYALDSYGTSFWVFAADLNADGSQRTQDYGDLTARTSLGFQTIWSSTNDPTLRMGGSFPSNLGEAVRFGLDQGADYFEIYAVDVLNPDPEIQGAIALVHGTADDSALLLGGGRFEVRASWTAPDGSSGAGHPQALTADTGYFWFFGAENVEVVAKVLNGCGVSGAYWVFASGLTNLRVELNLTDTATGAVKTYVNPQGSAFQPIQDTSAFATCP